VGGCVPVEGGVGVSGAVADGVSDATKPNGVGEGVEVGVGGSAV
jgi:hypothetical protein